jgi:cysteine synthase A
MIIESPLDLIFRDLFYRLRDFAGNHKVFLKLEGFNISGSIKIKTAIGLIEDLENREIISPNESIIVESSSGNLGLALSLLCAVKGHEFICVTDVNANRANIRGMELYGAKVIIVEDRDSGGGIPGRPVQGNRPDIAIGTKRGLAQPIRQPGQQECSCRANGE